MLTDDAMEVSYVPTTLPWARVHRNGQVPDWVEPHHVEKCDRGVCAHRPHYWYRYKDIVARLCMGRQR